MKHHYDELPEPIKRSVFAEVPGLPETVTRGILTVARMDLSDVRVHYDSRRPEAIQAGAYTQGRDIYLAPGQEHRAAHEACHVVQQAHGRVLPAADAEREAEYMAARANLAGSRGS